MVYTKKKDKEYFLTAPGKGSKGGGGAGGGGGPALEECTEAEILIEEAQEKTAEILSADILSGLTDANWKARLTAIESFINVSYNMLRYCSLVILHAHCHTIYLQLFLFIIFCYGNVMANPVTDIQAMFE